jgi:hypothetical protein
MHGPLNVQSGKWFFIDFFTGGARSNVLHCSEQSNLLSKENVSLVLFATDWTFKACHRELIKALVTNHELKKCTYRKAYNWDGYEKRTQYEEMQAAELLLQAGILPDDQEINCLLWNLKVRIMFTAPPYWVVSCLQHPLTGSYHVYSTPLLGRIKNPAVHCITISHPVLI